MSDPAVYIEDEWFVVRHSGEMPEVAFHSSIHFLSHAEDGPKLVLTEEQLVQLKHAAAQQYRDIVLRDLQQANRGRTIYRGIKRSIINYNRYLCFCERQNFSGFCFAADIAASLLLFLTTETIEVAKGGRAPVINCSFDELNHFAQKVGLVNEQLPHSLACLCQEST